MKISFRFITVLWVLLVSARAQVATPPVITGQPTRAFMAAGSTAALTVSASGSGLTYQWFKGALTNPVAGATDATLILPNVSPADSDGYFCRVTNVAGGVFSNFANLTVGPAGGLSRLANLSVRTTLASGQLLIMGFTTTGAKDVLVRGVGPKLADFAIANFYADPKLEIYDSLSRKTTENDNWNVALAPTFTALGAFALDPGSKDAALVTNVTGGYTAQLKGTGSGGILVEVYDAGPGVTPRLNNVSARNFVGTGGNVLIAGFNVDGLFAKTLLIRGIGPRLGVFGLTGFLENPKVELYNSDQVKIAENDNWSPTIAAVSNSVGAFGLNGGGLDAAMLISLPPGGYTVQISGADGGTGEGLIEVYEVP